jgi:hypothetical protein
MTDEPAWEMAVSGNGPLGATEEVGGLVELGCHVEVVDLGGLAVGSVEADEGVDLEVGDCSESATTTGLGTRRGHSQCRST